MNGDRASASSQNSTDSYEKLPTDLQLPRLVEMLAMDPNFLSPRDRKKDDLELLQCHRMSQVAETGQLKPRSRVSPTISLATTPTPRDSADSSIAYRKCEAQSLREPSFHPEYNRNKLSSHDAWWIE
jgi:hypothetical protein